MKKNGFTFLQDITHLGMQHNPRRCGFTLAEVLITLLAIGIVAALTVPTLISNSQKQSTVEKLKKEYTSLSQAVKQSEIDNGSVSTWDWGSDQATILASFNTYWAPYLKILKSCQITTDCGYSNNLMALDKSTSIGPVSPTVRTSVILADGTILIVLAPEQYIIIDINGSKLPNVYGKDVFWFILDPTKEFMPYGYNAGSSINTNCAKTASGQYCAAKIMQDGWQINSDYPWP